MAMPVVNGAMCSCTFGVAPCPLMATSQQQALAVNMPVATISDVFIHGKSNGRQCNGGRTGRSDANAVYACPGRRMGARFPDRTGGR